MDLLNDTQAIYSLTGNNLADSITSSVFDILPSGNLINEDGIYSTEYSNSINSNNSSNNSDELFQGYSEGLLTFASITCIFFIFIGVPGNLITIIALSRCKKVRNATAVFIINLSLSDLLFCCFNLPLAASTFWLRSWKYDELLCRLFPLMRYGLLAVSLFTVLAITINRYVMIGHPRIYPRIYRHRYLGIMVACTWIGAFIALIPTWHGIWGKFGLDKSIGSCSILRDHNNSSPKEFLFIMAFIVPCFCIIICYARIFYIVRKTAMRTHEPILTSSSVRMLGKSQRSLLTQDNNHSDRQLIEKSSRTSKDENSENSSSISNSSGYPPSQALPPPSVIQKELHKDLITTSTTSVVHPKIISFQQQQQQQQRPYLSKLTEDEMKFIDTSIDSDFPPSLSALKYREKRESTPGSTVDSIKESYEEEDIERGIENSIKEVDSAVESGSSSENNQVFHITPNNNDTCNQLLSVHVEPSSSSGVDLPLDPQSPPKKRYFKKSLKSSINRLTSRKNRKPSTMNTTSGASVLYPGRMTAKDRRLLKMILVIFLSFVICYLPITVTKLWQSSTDSHIFNIMGYLLIYLTTCINPIIYVVMSSEYRQAYWNLLLCRTMNGGGGGNNGIGNGSALMAKRSSKLKIQSQRT